jgi:hypothetical protein
MALVVLGALLDGPSVLDAGAIPDIDKAWLNRYGTNGRDWFSSVVVGGDGSLYAVGRTWGSGGDVSGVARGGGDFVVGKFGSDGSMTWIKRYGTNTDDYFNSVVVAGDGSLYAVGQMSWYGWW